MPSLFYCEKETRLEIYFHNFVTFWQTMRVRHQESESKEEEMKLERGQRNLFLFFISRRFYKSSWIIIKRNFYCSHIEPFNLSHEEEW